MKNKAKQYQAPLPIFMEPPEPSEMMSKVYSMMSSPDYNVADIAKFIRNTSVKFPYLGEIFGIITDEQLEEISNKVASDEEVAPKPVVTNGTFEVLDLVKMDKSVKKSFAAIPTKEEARYLMDIYYQTQNRRIVIQNQLRAIKQGVDNQSEVNGAQNQTFLEWYLYNCINMEAQIAKGLDAFSDSNFLSRWAKSVKGIGPTIATCLSANLEIFPNDAGTDTDMHAGNWWSYCGLNDNNRPWISKDQSKEIVEKVIAEHDGVIDLDTVAGISALTQWPVSHYEKLALDDKGNWSKTKLINSSSIIPYNKKMKVLMFKIGHSFMMNKNKEDSLYGRHLKLRAEMEAVINEDGGYAEQAENILSKYNYGKSTVAYSYYSQGKLPPAHLAMRAQRYATKLFISHLFEAQYYNMFGRRIKNPYVLSFVPGHADYIEPEVPYESIERDPKYLEQ